MIVDDNDLLLEILFEVLSWEGFEVIQASNGREAFDIVKSRKIDLVVSDIQMPDGDGVELMIKIHNLDTSNRPGLILTSGNTASLKFDPADYNVLAVAPKPIDYGDLIQTIHKLPFNTVIHARARDFIHTTG